MVSLKSWAHSDLGRRRSNNEDAYFHDGDLGLFMVADGMGGHKGGDFASRLAIEVASETYRELRAKNSPLDEALAEGFAKAAKTVHQESLHHASLRGMGTTLSALAFDNDRAFAGHIGDSRIYRLRDTNFFQLTNDHSLVNEHVQAGVISQEEARKSALRNIITRAIGHNQIVRVDYFPVSLEVNDIFLLCTDGLNNMLLDGEISKLISQTDHKKAVKQLIDNANHCGGDDNITAILVRVYSDGDKPESLVNTKPL